MNILPIHITILILNGIIILLADREAFAWFRGKKETLDKNRIDLYHTLMWVGLIGMIVTGVIMALPGINFLLGNPLFLLKMFFVLCLVINAFFIGRLNKITFKRSYASLTQKEKTPLFISGAVSVISWVGATIVAIIVFGD